MKNKSREGEEKLKRNGQRIDLCWVDRNLDGFATKFKNFQSENKNR